MALNLKNPDKWSPSLLSSLGPLLPLLENDDVTEIEVYNWDHIRVKGRGWKGHRLIEGPDGRWGSPGILDLLCTAIGNIIDRSVNEEKPVLDARLPGGERVHIVKAPCALEGAVITIRKFPKEPMTIEKLLGYGSINQQVADVLTGLIDVRRNIIVAGGTESGKTSLLNALSLLISDGERVLTIEDARELVVQVPCWVALETLKPWASNVDPIHIADLVKASLRMSPDRIVVGEVRGEEALYMLRAFSTGHSGGLSTIHSNSAPDGLRTLQMLAGFSKEISSDPYTLASIVARAVDVVVFVSKIEEDNSRKVTEIIEVDRPEGLEYMDGGRVRYRYRTICKFDFRGFGEANVYGFPTVLGEWVFPDRPTSALIRSIAARNSNPSISRAVVWPEESLQAPDRVSLA
jgi:pilus assembly protein CpaF